jgi:hypothetical protein
MLTDATMLFPDPCHANALFQSLSFFDASLVKYDLQYLPFFPLPPIFLPSPIRSYSGMIRSVRSSSRLTSLQLIQIPPTHRHVTLVLIHAACEALDILRTRARLLLLLLLGRTSISSLRIVEPVIRRLRVRVLCWLLVLILCWLCRRATAEPATDSMANGGSDCNTTIWQNQSVSSFRIGGCS